MDGNTTMIKFTTAWGAVVVAFSWAEAAAMLAAIYTALLILEWIWKHGGREACKAICGGVRRLFTRRSRPLRVIKTERHGSGE